MSTRELLDALKVHKFDGRDTQHTMVVVLSEITYNFLVNKGRPTAAPEERIFQTKWVLQCR